MNKPGRALKGTNPYLKKGGGKGLMGGQGNEYSGTELGQRIDYLPEFPELEGQYVYGSGATSANPAQDTRGFFGRMFKPDNAGRINQEFTMARNLRGMESDAAIADERARQGIITQSMLERAKNELALQEPYQPIVNNFSSPGDVPWQYTGDPSELIANRDKIPYVPINAKGVEGNIAYQTQLSNIERQKAQEKLWQDQLGIDKQRLGLTEKDLNSPKVITAGPALFSVSPDGTVTNLGIVQHGDEGGKPIITKDASGNLVPGVSPRIPAAWQPAPRVVASGIPPIVGGGLEKPYTQQSYATGVIGPASTQQNNFVVGEASRDGMKKEVAGPLGTAPTVDPDTQATGIIPSMIETVNRFKGTVGDVATGVKAIGQDLPFSLKNTFLDVAEKFYRPPGGYERPTKRHEALPLPKKQDKESTATYMSAEEEASNLMQGMTPNQQQELLNWLEANPGMDNKRVKEVIEFIKKERK